MGELETVFVVPKEWCERPANDFVAHMLKMSAHRSPYLYAKYAVPNPFNVSLRLLYNAGRLPLKLWYNGGRVVFVKADHERDYIKTDKGVYLCKYCGREMNTRHQLFCSSKCEWDFNYNVGRYLSWQEFRCHVFERDGKRCKICGKDLTISDVDTRGRKLAPYSYVCDHIVPLSHGGTDWHNDPDMINFQTLCVLCNSKKTGADLSKPKTAKEESKRNVTLAQMGASAYIQTCNLQKFMEAKVIE